VQRYFDIPARNAVHNAAGGEDVNHLQPAHEFMVMYQHGREFVSNPEENPVILSNFFCPADATLTTDS